MRTDNLAGLRVPFSGLQTLCSHRRELIGRNVKTAAYPQRDPLGDPDTSHRIHFERNLV